MFEESTPRAGEREDQPQDMRHLAETSGAEQESRGADPPAEKVAQAARQSEEADEQMRRLEEDPPERLEDWPEGEAKYETFGGPEGEHGYHEGPEQKLGPADVHHRPDGSVEVEGEEVQDPGEYKREPIPGGPTDPHAPDPRDD